VATSRVIVLPSDIRVTRFQHHAPATTVFALDASGSSALYRMAEAKGAIELLLAQCYGRREKVAVVAFRGRRAEVLLPPTRALARARRALSGLPGGGATPLAAGIDAAHALALAARRAGDAALIVILTDGRANIDRTGTADRRRANSDAEAAAQGLAADRLPAMVIDTSPVPGPKAGDLARAMRARYIALPHAGAREIAGIVARAGASAQ
jgi:magnesium chelatase subunit D